MTSSTRSLRNLRSVSPGADELAPTEPLPAQALNQLCTVVREKLLVAQGERPSVRVRAVFRRKDEPNEPTQMLEGKIRKEGLELWGVWSDEPNKEYPFPYSELNYYRVDIQDEMRITESENLRTSNDPTAVLPRTQTMTSRVPRPVTTTDHGEQGLPGDLSASETTPPILDPNALDPYEPITYEPWLLTLDEGGFRTRDLMRELRDAPEFGLRVNQFFQDRSFVKQQERNFTGIFCKWIVLARQTPGWNQGAFIEMGRAIVQMLRDAYWRARRVDVELVHEKLQKEVRPNDKFYHHVSDQLAERQKHYARAYTTYTAQSTAARSYPQDSGFNRPPTTFRRGGLCFGCRSPDHMWRNCPKRFQQPDFRSRVAGPAHSGKNF